MTCVPVVAANMDTVGTFEMAPPPSPNLLKKATGGVAAAPRSVGGRAGAPPRRVRAQARAFAKHHCLVAIHKHYTVDAWTAFVAESPDAAQ